MLYNIVYHCENTTVFDTVFGSGMPSLGESLLEQFYRLRGWRIEAMVLEEITRNWGFLLVPWIC